MEKIPTAEDFIKVSEIYDKDYSTISLHDAEQRMIEFAKLHVEAALKEIEIQRCTHHYPPIQFINKTDLIKNIK